MDSDSKKPRVCIIGAGASGLCACRHLLKHEIADPVVLEASDGVGGVWRSNCLSITKLQTPAPAYQFSDFPWPDGTPWDASGAQVLQYLEAYATRFGIREHIRFDSRVLRIGGKFEEEGDGGSCGPPWELLVEHSNNGAATQETLEFDFIILCIGRFGDVPRLPSFPIGKGPEVFKGKIMHSIDYAALSSDDARDLLSGKRVVVVGFSKSALDVATEAALANEGKEGKSCTIVFRRAHWMFTQWYAFGVHLGYLYGTRLSEMFVQKPGQGLFSTLLSLLLFPMKWAVSKFVEIYLRTSFPLAKHGVVPEVPFYQQVASCKVAVIPEHFFDHIEQGRINLCKSWNWHYVERGLRLDKGKEVEADVVVLCTGFQGETKLKSILPKEYADVLQGPDGVVPLYRGVIHPRIPGMAIIGYQEDISNIRASEMGSRWLSYLLAGKFKLPEPEVMEESANSWIEYMKRSTPYFDRACTTAIRTWQCDEQCRDIGWKPRRKKTWLQELLTPYSNMDYVDP